MFVEYNRTIRTLRREEKRIEFAKIKRTVLVLFGACITAVGLQFFLLPNNLIDGGVTGASIVVSHLTGLPLGFFLVLLNIPFVILGYKKFGKEFAVLSLAGITTLAALTFFHVEHGFTDVPILAAVFGGSIIGVGVGLVVRYGGILDGSDTIALLIDRSTVFSVGEAIMVINGIIISIAGFIFGWERALYSLIAYFVVHKAIDITVEGLDESRCLWIVSLDVRAIGKVINELIQEPVTYIKESNPKDREPHGVMLVVITRLEEQKIKTAIREVDPRAFIAVTPAHEVIGKVSEDSIHLRPG